MNGKLVPIDYVIQNGDRIEIITSQNSKGPSRDWLNIVKSTQAKNKINQWFRSELKEENILKGKELLIASCKAKGIHFPDINKTEYQNKILNKYGFHDWNSCLATIGHGGLKEGQIVNRMYEEYRKDHPVRSPTRRYLRRSPRRIRRKYRRSAPRAASLSKVFTMWRFIFPNAAVLFRETRSSGLSREGGVSRSTARTVSM